VRACVILNPAAKGQRAARFRHCLETISTECVLQRTSAPGEARKLAATAVRAGFETIIAAGGDGTLNEVLNGVGEAPDGFARTRMGILPLGTVNVFARELGLPTQPDAAWAVLRQARESRIDLGCVEHHSSDAPRREYFVQLAGAGLDARAIELVNWPLKKRIGPLAYIVAGQKALAAKPAEITVSCNSQTVVGELVLVGNGRLYGGPFRVFPHADLRDGLLDLCVFPRANWWTLLRCGLPLLIRRQLPQTAITRLRAESVEMKSAPATPFEMDGELAGHLPVTISVQRNSLRILIP
jgi:YegS/Rv2252/BmrU family lipid kinase